jgi:hypothetical protein
MTHEHKILGPTPRRKRASDPGRLRPPLVREVLAGPGRQLDPDATERMGSRFGQDFSMVRVHTDAKAAESARSLSARAYTVGHHIVFGANDYRPGSEDGDRLIAHELTHVLQQGAVGDVSSNDIVLEESGSHFDDEASIIAERIMQPSRSHSEAGKAEASAAPVMATKVPRAPNTVVLQRALIGGLVGGGIGGILGAVAGFALGGPVGAIIGGLLGAAAGGVIGAFARSTFPSYDMIVADANVQARTNAAWGNTLAAATPAGRREEGFWIRLNTQTGRYEFTPTVLGPVVGPMAGGSVVLGARPADLAPGTPTAVYTVASFHTHTPTAFRPVGRPVGPSGADHTADTSDDVVGVVYDYREIAPGAGTIPAGHPLASPADLYHSGPDRRQRV